MAKVAFNDALVWYNGVDISGLSNACSLGFDADVVETTNFASGGWRERVSVLKSAEWSIAGFIDDDADGLFQTDLGETYTELPISLVPFKVAATVAEGDTAYSIGSLRSSFSRPSQLGDMLRFNVTAPSTRSGGRGQVLDYQTGITATANSTGRQLGALSATQVLQCNLHVFSGTGTIVFTLESDALSDFASATTRATFALSAVGAEMETVVGAVTDDWWRLLYTVTSGTWTFGCCAAII